MTDTCNCDRCGALCQVGADCNPDARLMRKSAVPKGLCVDCAMTNWLKSIEPLPGLFERRGPEVLLQPAIQVQVAQVLMAANADARADEVNWRTVITNWPLPFPSKRRARGREAGR